MRRDYRDAKLLSTIYLWKEVKSQLPKSLMSIIKADQNKIKTGQLNLLREAGGRASTRN